PHPSLSLAPPVRTLRPSRPPLFPYTTLFRSKSLAADGEAHVVAVGLHHLHLRYVQHVHAAAGLRQHARLRLGACPRAAFQLLERSEEHTSELQSHLNLVCRLLLEKKNN